MGKTLDKLLALAESQVGYTEKDNDKDLDTKVGSTAGDGNHTKYAKELESMSLPGYCGSAWCASYQMWLEVQTVGKEQALKNMGPKFYSCFAVRDYAKSQKRWLEPSGLPRPGDLVIFKQSHVARVIKVTATKIYTNEGNTSNGTAVVRNGGMVCVKSYERSNSSIMGYVVMKYKDAVTLVWEKDKQGRYKYIKASGQHAINEWLIINHHWYLFGKDGYMLTGWQRWNGSSVVGPAEPGDWYYFDETPGGPLEGACWHTRECGAQEIWYVDLADNI